MSQGNDPVAKESGTVIKDFLIASPESKDLSSVSKHSVMMQSEKKHQTMHICQENYKSNNN